MGRANYWLWLVAAVAAIPLNGRSQEEAFRPPAGRHVAELASYLQSCEIYVPIHHRQLAVFPIRQRGGEPLRGRWLALDEALARGVVQVSEKGAGGQVPLVVVENRSRDEYVLMLAGELLAGGKQTRTMRQDVVLAPGQRVEVSVFCVEAHRWEGGAAFVPGKALLPHSLQQELRSGADQQRIWAEVARTTPGWGPKTRPAAWSGH